MAAKAVRPGAKGALSRDNILALATEAFAERGYLGTSLRDISERAGMTAASLYYHFRSKDDLLEQIIVTAVDTLIEILMRELGSDRPIVQRLSNMMREHMLFTVSKASESRIILNESRFVHNDKQPLLRQKQLQILDIYRRLMEGLQSAGLAPQGDPTLAAFLLLSTVNGFAQWFRRGRSMQLEPAVQLTIDYALRGSGIAEQPERKTRIAGA